MAEDIPSNPIAFSGPVMVYYLFGETYGLKIHEWLGIINKKINQSINPDYMKQPGKGVFNWTMFLVGFPVVWMISLLVLTKIKMYVTKTSPVFAGSNADGMKV